MRVPVPVPEAARETVADRNAQVRRAQNFAVFDVTRNQCFTTDQGQEPEQFALKPADIIYVPEKFNWF
jgi:hypothetical protein